MADSVVLDPPVVVDTPEDQESVLTKFTQRIEHINVNEVVNTAIPLVVALAVFHWLGGLNHDIMRGWSPAELVVRTSMDGWASYNNVLNIFPLQTKAITSATVYTIGDVISQRTEGVSMGELDRPRILRSLLAGLIGHGPLSHYWYNFSEEIFNNIHLTEWWSFAPKVLIDQMTWGPLWNNLYIIMLGTMKLESFDVMWGDVKRTTVPLIVSGFKIWGVAHSITYGLIPVENRLLWVDIVEILWVSILATTAASSSHGDVPPLAIETDADSTPKEATPTTTT